MTVAVPVRAVTLAAALALVGALVGPTTAQLAPGEVVTAHKLGHYAGSVIGTPVDDTALYGWAMTALGDVDGDGIVDLAVAAPGDGHGSVWIHFLRADGTTRDARRIGSLDGVLQGLLDDSGSFAQSVCALGDLDGDGVPDLAVGEPGRAGAGVLRGGVWILFLESDGSVKSFQLVDDTNGGFGGPLANSAYFGSSLAAVGDLDGDGVTELAVGAPGTGAGRGAAWILFMEPDGTVAHEQHISDTEGGFGGTIVIGDSFGSSVAPLGDLDGDGHEDIAVGARFDNTAAGDGGAVWILFLLADGTVASHTHVTEGSAGFTGDLDNDDAFGTALALLGDLNGDGHPDLAVGASDDDDGPGVDRGAVYNLFLAPDGTVSAHAKISSFAGGFGGALQAGDELGHGLAALGDLDGDHRVDLAVGAPRDDGAGTSAGTAYVVFLALNGTVKSEVEVDVTALLGGLEIFIEDGEAGRGVSVVEDIDGNGVVELATIIDGEAWLLPLQPDLSVLHPRNLGVPALQLASIGDLDNDGVGDLAAGLMSLSAVISGHTVDVILLDAEGDVKSTSRFGANGAGGFGGDVDVNDGFGGAIAPLGDFDGDGVGDLAVGALGDDDVRLESGAVWLVFMNADGTVKSEAKISNASGGLGALLEKNDRFGAAVACLGDLDGDGVVDLAVGAPGDDGGGAEFSERGAVWILLLHADGTVKAAVEIDDDAPGMAGAIDDGERFGISVAAIGDVDLDGVTDLAVGAVDDFGAGVEEGTLTIVFLDDDGTALDHVEIGENKGGFDTTLVNYDAFGAALAPLGDIDGDGRLEIAVAAPGDDGGGTPGLASDDYGAIWLLELRPGPWSDIGGGLAGTHGVPSLTGSGALVGDEIVSITLAGARESTTFVLVVGLTFLGAPFKGGTMVPALDQLFFGLPTGAEGGLVISGPFPTGMPRDTELYLQAWVVDPAGPVGFAASNGLYAITP